MLSHTDEKVFEKITSAVGISMQDVTNIDENAGGAQYILKNIDPHFWRKVYSDSETIYTILSDYNTEELQKSIINRIITKKNSSLVLGYVVYSLESYIF